MILTTSKGTTHEATLAILIESDGSLLIQLRDIGTPLSEIAAAFEGLTFIEAEDGRRWEDKTDLRIVYRLNADTVQIRLYTAAETPAENTEPEEDDA